jgi:hypothetical protein
MARTEQQIIDDIQTTLQDTSATIWTEAELRTYKDWALKELARYIPYKRVETLAIETRFGNATSTTSNALVDSKAQFLSTDADKRIYNTTDKTWAIVTTYVSTSQLTLSKDIMAAGESYEIYNRYCMNNHQLDLSPVDDWVSIDGVEYPYGYLRGVKMLDGGRVLELKYDGWLNDTNASQTNSQRDTWVHLNTIHRLPQLTDLTGAVNNAPGYAAGSTSMAINGLSGSETIPQHSLFRIATARGLYRTTASCTLTGGGGSISFFPGLMDAAVNSDVVTIEGSTLTPTLEECLSELIIAKAHLSKAPKYANATSTRNSAFGNYLTIGNREMAEIKHKLTRMSLKQTTEPART